jgi:hypothetical protein
VILRTKKKTPCTRFWFLQTSEKILILNSGAVLVAGKIKKQEPLKAAIPSGLTLVSTVGRRPFPTKKKNAFVVGLIFGKARK